MCEIRCVCGELKAVAKRKNKPAAAISLAFIVLAERETLPKCRLGMVPQGEGEKDAQTKQRSDATTLGNEASRSGVIVNNCGMRGQPEGDETRWEDMIVMMNEYLLSPIIVTLR